MDNLAAASMDNLAAALASGGTQPNILGPVVPLLKILCMCMVGLLLTHPRIGVLGPDSCKLLSKLVFALFLPCLIFTELGKSVTPKNMRDWWFIPVNVLASYLIGCVVGYLVAILCRPPPRLFRFTVAMTGIGNTGNLPLSIVGSVCHGWNPFGKQCKQSGVAYVSFAQWVAVIVLYVFVYHMLEPPRDYYCYIDELGRGEEIIDQEGGVQEEEEQEIQAAQMPDFVEAEWPGVKDAGTEETRTPFLDRIFRRASFNERRDPVVEDHERVRCLREPRVVRKMRILAERTPLQHMLQPPTVASLLAILVGSVHYLQSVAFGEGAPLEFFTDALTILGNAMVPCVLLVLGGMFSGGPAKSELGLRTTVGICVARLVVLPAIGIGVVVAANRGGFLPQGDKMFHFVLLLQHAMPSSILMAGLTSVRGYGEKEASSVLFWQHIFSVVSLAGYIGIYFKYISYI
ncbi:protein PIN-LIKES 2 [Selaginella moellendorffii]|nr:protein PIN-LIKES 2 [Selaginella moellendorffii]|eukprot:XP_002977054.2 protein PIN-LIKES 2 [Selaginella moellendorffii]